MIIRYYLSSLESHALETVRVCNIVSIKHFPSGKECAVADLDTPIAGIIFGLTFDVTEIILAARHEGDRLSDIREFPCFVHVARPLVSDIQKNDIVAFSDLENLAWGELYRTRYDAQNHVFDRAT